MTKYKVKCTFCGDEDEFEVIGKVLKVSRCDKCGGFRQIIAEKYEPEEAE